MSIDRAFVGRSYPAATTYEVSREKIRDFALAIGDRNPVYLDRAAARAAGHPDVIAPPTFLTVLSFRYAADGPLADPALGLDYRMVVHGDQRFELRRPVAAGDLLDSVTTIEGIRDIAGNEMLTLRTEVVDAAGGPVATLTSTIVSRGTAAPKGA